MFLEYFPILDPLIEKCPRLHFLAANFWKFIFFCNCQRISFHQDSETTIFLYSKFTQLVQKFDPTCLLRTLSTQLKGLPSTTDIAPWIVLGVGICGEVVKTPRKVVLSEKTKKWKKSEKKWKKSEKIGKKIVKVAFWVEQVS